MLLVFEYDRFCKNMSYRLTSEFLICSVYNMESTQFQKHTTTVAHQIRVVAVNAVPRTVSVPACLQTDHLESAARHDFPVHVPTCHV